MTVLLVLILTLSVVGVGLMGEMYRKDQPILGVASLGTLMLAAVLGTVYGTLGSA